MELLNTFARIKHRQTQTLVPVAANVQVILAVWGKSINGKTPLSDLTLLILVNTGSLLAFGFRPGGFNQRGLLQLHPRSTSLAIFD